MTAGGSIALVGAGTMGLPMGQRLVEAGYALRVYDIDQQRAAATGGTVASSLAEATSAAEFVVLSLPMPGVVRDVVTGPGGIAESCSEGTVVVDASTITPALARELAALLAERGIEYLDAPVSGGPVSIPRGQLAVMVGGERAAFGRALPVLQDLAGYIEYVGPSGAGQVVKLANNLMVGAFMVGISEACALVEREGVDAALAYDVFRHTTASSRLLEARYPIAGVDESHPSSQDFAPRFSLALMKKDLDLAMETAKDRGLSLDLCAAASEAYGRAAADGMSDRDFSAVYLEIAGTHGRPGP